MPSASFFRCLATALCSTKFSSETFAPSSSSSCPLLLFLIPFSSAAASPRGGPRRHLHRPPPVDQSQLDHAISTLPPRFSPPDLCSALSALPDPRLCPLLLSWALHHHPRFIRLPPSFSSSATAVDPFMVAVKRLGTARLYSEMESVASLALSLPSLPFAEPHFNTLIYFYTEARKLSKAVYVYKRMRASPDPAARPTSATYNLLFAALLGRDGGNSYIHHVYMDTIRALFRQMVEAGVAPDLLALNAVIKGYVQSLHLNDALRVFHQMSPVYGVDPNEHTYSYLLHGLCAQGRTRNARELFEVMRKKDLVPSKKACNSLVSALAIAGDVQKAAKVMWEVAQLGRVPDQITCKTLLEEICRQGKLEDAKKLLNEMEKDELVDGRQYKELLHGIEDEFGGLDDLIPSNLPEKESRDLKACNIATH